MRTPSVFSLKTLAKTFVSLPLEILGVAFGMYSLRLLKDCLVYFPQGNGQVVLFIPGFGAGFECYVIFWAVLKYKGYRPILWRPGRNWGPKNNTAEEHLSLQIQELFLLHGEMVIVCHSAGYPYACKMGHHHPTKIKMIISFGGLHNADTITHIHPGMRIFYWLITGEDPERSWRTAKENNVHIPPKEIIIVAVTGKGDKVLEKEVTRVKRARKNGAMRQNIKIFARHAELIFSVKSWVIMLDQLSFPGRKFRAKKYPIYFG